MRSKHIGACAGVVIIGVALGGYAQPPEGRGKPADASRSSIAMFPVAQQSVGVMQAAGLIQSQRPAPPPPTMTVPGSANRGIGHAFGNGNGSGKGTGNGNDLSIGQVAKAPGNATGIDQIEKEPADEKQRRDGNLYSLQAVLPVAPGAFPVVQQSVPIPDCLGR